MTTQNDPMKFSEFLESCPPNQSVPIVDLVDLKWYGSNRYYYLTTPEIQLHCTHDNCNGVRFFRCTTGHDFQIDNNQTKDLFLTYLCSNCQSNTKEFAIRALRSKTGDTGMLHKYGEFPVYGPPTPAKLLKLVGGDRELFLKGRRCENQGLGVGAFVYYRRVVESQKDRIFKEIKKVLIQLQAPQSKIDTIDAAIAETQFSKAIDIASPSIPESLFIGGHNPLKLLYRALSEGIHNQSDEHCLGIAASARVILIELSERLSQALKDEAELTHAISRLLSTSDQRA